MCPPVVAYFYHFAAWVTATRTFNSFDVDLRSILLTIFWSKFNFYKNLYCFNSSTSYLIITSFCTWRNSTAVASYAKFDSDCLVGICMRTKWYFHWIGFVMIIWLMGPCWTLPSALWGLWTWPPRETTPCLQVRWWKFYGIFSKWTVLGKWYPYGNQNWTWYVGDLWSF